MRKFLLCGVASIALMPVCVAMESQAAESDGFALEEIVVTAERRAQSLQNVPISISAFTAETLAKANITEAKSYLQFAPNIAFTEDGQTGGRSINISIRGISNINLGEATTVSSIGYYIDDLSVGSVANGTINPQLQDMERIEVLRGPQGTYFGRNALGGAINITTKKPDENLYGEVSGSFGRFNTWGIEAIANLPVADNFFIRAVAAHNESDGFIKNVNPAGTPNSGYKYDNIRVSARILPSEQLTIDLSATYTDEDGGMDNSVGSGVLDLDTKSIFGANFVPIDQGLGFYPDNQRLVNHNRVEYNNNEFVILNGRISYAADGFDVKSITGYIYSKNERSFDQDNIGVDAINRTNDWSGDSFSQEIRLQSNNDSALSWTVGGIYAKDTLDLFNSVFAGAEGSYTDPDTGDVIGLLPPIPAGFRINENNYSFKTKSYGIFAEAGYNFTEQLSLTVGGRYTEDKVSVSSFGVVAFESVIPDASGSGKFTNFSPRAVLKYLVDDNLTTYASVARGYKNGGVDINGGIETEFKPETLWNYEVGFKSTLWDDRLRLNGSVFYARWNDLQVQTNYLADPNDISSAVSKTLNADKATNKGAEIELQALVAEGLQVGFGAGYLDSKFGDFPGAVLAGGSVVDLSGKRIPKTPEWSLNGVVDYTTPISDNLEGFVRAEWVYRDEIAGNLEATAISELGLGEYPYISPSYNVINLRAGINTDRISVVGFVENLFKEDYFNGNTDDFGLGGIRLQPHPRIWGLKVTFKTN